MRPQLLPMLRRASASESGLLLFAFVAMASSIALDHGHYSRRALLLLLTSAGFLMAAARRWFVAAVPGPVDIESGPALESLLAVGLVAVLVIGASDSPGVSLQNPEFRYVVAAVQCGLGIAVVAFFLSPWGSPAGRRMVVIGGIIAGMALRVAMIRVSLSPGIDVFAQFQESAAHLLHGLNPYDTPVSDPYGGRLDFGYHVIGYSYPPAGLYAQTAAFYIGGDIRYAYVVFEAVALVALYSIAVGEPPEAAPRRDSAGLLVLLFLFHPRGLFEIEQAWNEPLLVGCAGVFLWLASRRPRSRWVSAAFGALLSVKQYLVFFALLWFVPRHRWRGLPIAAAVVLATWVPFLVWNASSAITNGLLFQFRTPFRPDGLTVMAALHQGFGWTPGKGYAIAIGIAAAAVSGWAVRARPARELSGWLYASVLTTLAVFLAGSQAFANYYYFLGTLILFLIAIRWREISPMGEVVADTDR